MTLLLLHFVWDDSQGCRSRRTIFYSPLLFWQTFRNGYILGMDAENVGTNVSLEAKRHFPPLKLAPLHSGSLLRIWLLPAYLVNRVICSWFLLIAFLSHNKLTQTIHRFCLHMIQAGYTLILSILYNRCPYVLPYLHLRVKSISTPRYFPSTYFQNIPRCHSLFENRTRNDFRSMFLKKWFYMIFTGKRRCVKKTSVNLFLIAIYGFLFKESRVLIKTLNFTRHFKML